MECKNCGYKLKKKQSVCPRCGYSFDYKKYEKEKRAGLAAASVGAVGLSTSILNKIKNIGNKTDAGFTVNASEIDNINPVSNKSVADNNFLDALSLDDSFTKSAVGENGSFSGEYGFGKPLTRVETADIDINDKISEILGLYDINLDKPLTFTDTTFEIKSQSENKTIPNENTSFTVNSTGTTNTTSKSITTDNSTVNNLSSEDTLVTNTNVQGNSENTKGASVTSASVQSNTEGTKTIANDSINIDENGYYFDEEQLKTTLSSFGLEKDEINQVVEAARTGGEDSANKALTEIYGKRIEEYQKNLVVQMNNKSISEEDIINSLNNQDTNASQTSDSIDLKTLDEEKMKTALTDSGLTQDEASKVIEAYKTGEQDKITAAYNDINAARSQAAEEEMRNNLIEGGLTQDEADKVIEAYKTGDQTNIDNAYNEINESRYAQNEQSMRENLAANGFSDEEINRIIEAGKAGGDESVNQVLSEINAERTKQYENNLVDQLKQGGLSDEEISKVMEAYKTGDQTAVDNAYNEINAAKTQEAEKTMRDSLAASGMSEEDIERVMEAARTGGPDAANHTLEQINAERAKAYEEQLVKQLKESGITDEEISQVLDAYKTGDQDKVTEVLNEISEKHFEESLNEMRKSLLESGLTEEEVNSVIAAAREGGDTGANQALEAISEARAKAQEDQIAAQLRASGVDEDTILNFIKAYRNGDQNTIDKIYAQINAKKEWELRNQLSENFDPDTVDKLVAAYMSGDQKTIDAIYAELAAKREEEFIQNLINNGITNEQDLKEAREAYRSGDQKTLNKKLDEITSSYIKFDQKGSNDVALPKAYRIEAILALFGSCDDTVKMGNGVTITVNNRFTSNSKISDIRSGNVTHESFQDVFSSIIDEASSGNFSKYDTTGTNQFGSFSLGGANFSTNISNYYDFLSTLKGDLMSLRNTLIRVEGEQFYYLQLEFDMAFDSMNSAGEANVDFYQQMGNLGIINYDAGVSASENEDIINFNNQIYERLSEYYDDEAGSEEMLAKLNPLNQPFSDKEMDKARARYEATASQIIIMLNRAATKGLVDLQYEYENGATFADFTEAQFNEQCRDADGNIIFDYPNYNPNSNDPMAKLSQANRDMAAFLFQQELLTSMDNASQNRSDTELYREFVDGAVNYSDDLNRKPNGEIDIEGYKLDPDCFAYSVISLAVQKEAFCPYTGQWRPGEVSNEYYNLARSYNPNTDGPYPEYLKNSGMATPRTALGNRVVDTFANIVNNKTSGQRLDCEYLNGSTLEEAFWLSYQFNEVTNPAYNSAVNDLASFQNTVSANGPFEALNLTEQEDYEVLIERLKNNPEYAEMFDKDGNLLSDYANINNLTNEEQKLMYQKLMTNAILVTRTEIAEEANNNLLYQSQLFNLLIEQVDPTIVEKQIPVPSEEIKPRRPNEKFVLLDDKFETITETHYYRDANQQSGYDLYMKFVSDGSGSKDRASIGDYLPNMIISAEEFSSNPELVEKYKDYKSYTYAFPTISGKYYDEVTNYLSNKKPPLNADENYNWLDTYNKFNDFVIDVSFNSSQFHLQSSQFTENMLGQLTSEAGTKKAKETFMCIANNIVAAKAGANALNAMSVGSTSMANSQLASQKAFNNEAAKNAERARTFSDLKHNFANMQIDVTAAIGNMNYEAVNFASKYSDFYDLAEEFRNYYKDCELKLDYTKDDDGNPLLTYNWVNGNGRVEVSKEQQALMFILAEKDGQHVDWSLVDESVSKYAKNIKFLDKDENTNFDGVLNYLMFSRQKNINNDDAFAQQILNFSNLGFDTEARRRADEYTSDFFAKNISKLLNIKIEDNTDLIRQFGLTGLILASSEWLTEDVLLPVLHGVDGFIKSIGYAIGDTVMSATGNAHKIDFEPSLNDQTWAYVIDNYKQSGGFQMVNYYVTQAMTSLGNQAIPIALSYFSGGLSMGALFVSAYGNTLHSTLGEFVQYGHYNDQDEFEWATGRRPINAIIYALMDGAAEMVMEKVVGRMPGLSDSVSIGLKGFAKDIIGEMVEESLQEFLGPIFKDIATGDIRRSIANGTFDEQFFKFWGNEFDIEAIRDAAIIAAISSGVMNGAKNGKMIVKSLIDTNGQSSSLYQLLNLQENAMKAAGFTQEQIDQQIKANKNAALNNSANLKSLTQEILNSPSIESEYNSWKDGLGKNDPRGEMNLEEYASMRAIQSLSFDTTELQMQANLNTIRINQLESLLISDNQTKLRSELSELNAALEANPGDSTITDRINEIQSLLGDSKSGLSATLSELSTLIKANPNDMSIKEKLSQLQQYLSTSDHSYLNEEIETLRNQNTEINEQIAQVQTDARLTIDANTQTITELNTKLTELQELQKTATGEELTSINEQITTVEEQINQLTRQNEIIEFNMADNARVLESKIENNENTLSEINEIIDDEVLTDQDVDTLKNEIEILKQENLELNEKLEPALHEYAESLVVEETKALNAIAALQQINKTDLENMTPKQREIYTQVQDVLNNMNERLDIIRGELNRLEAKGVTVEVRPTLESIIKANQETLKQFENIADLEVTEFLKTRTDIGLPEGVLDKLLEGVTTNKDVNVQPNLEPGLDTNVTETVAQTPITTFTQNMTLVISPLIMNIGFNIGDLINQNGEIMHNFGPSCGRIINQLQTQTNELTLQFEGTPETDIDVRSDLEQKINMNNNALGNLTALMAEFGIDENSPLTALMEQMKFDKMQLEEMRHKNEMNELQKPNIPYMDMMQEVMWSLREVVNSDLSNVEKFNSFASQIKAISEQTNWTWQALRDQKVQIDSIDGININNSQTTIGEVLDYYAFMNEGNIQSILNDTVSYTESRNKIIDFLNSTPSFDSDQLLKKGFSGLSIDGREGPVDLNLNDIISFIENKQPVQNLSDGSEITAELTEVAEKVQDIISSEAVDQAQNIAIGEQTETGQTTVEVDLNQDVINTETGDIAGQSLNIEDISTEIVDKVIDNSNQETNSLKQRLLDTIESDMTQLEKIKLLYHELGSKVDYSEQFRYALNNKSRLEELYNALYSKKMTLKTLEGDRSIICVNWTQLYSEILEAAGIKNESIVIQRMIDENGDIAVGTHAGMFIVLDDGSVAMPDLTGRLLKNKPTDIYNVKVGNETTGFIYFTSDQVKQLSELVPNELSYGVKNVGPDGKPSNLNPTIESFLKYVSSFLFSNEFSSEEEANRIGLFDGNSFTFDAEVNKTILEYVSKENVSIKEALKKLGYKDSGYTTLKDARTTMENNFFKSMLKNKENKQIIADVDSRISQIFKSDFFLEELTQDLLKVQKDTDAQMVEFNKIDEQFVGLQNVNSTNMLDIYNYFNQTCAKEKLFRGDTKIDGDHISLESISENRTEIRFTHVTDGTKLTNYRVFINADGKIDVGRVVSLDSDFSIMDVAISGYGKNTLFVVNGKECSLSDIMTMSNERTVPAFTAEELNALLKNKELLKSYCDLLSGDNLTSFIQQLTFSEEVFTALDGVIKFNTIVTNIKASQIESLATCFDSLSSTRRNILQFQLLNSQSDDIFCETINHLNELKIDVMKAIDYVANRNIDGNTFFSKSTNANVNQYFINCYSTDERAKALIDSITDENVINMLKTDKTPWLFTRTDGSQVSLNLKDTLDMNGKTVYVYSVGNTSILSENNLIEMFLKGNASIKDFVINSIVSADSIEIAKLNKGIIPTYDINFEEGTYSIKSTEAMFEYFDQLSDVYTWFFEQSRHDNVYTQFGSNQKVRSIDRQNDILKQTKSGEYVLTDARYENIYNNMVDFLSKKYNVSQDMINTIIMKTIDGNRGACTYANLANSIFMKFALDAEGFKNTFGFDMYETIDGKKILNYRTLIADMYIQMNASSLSLAPHPIFTWIDGQMCFNTVTNEDGSTRPADSREQVYMNSPKVVKTYLEIHNLDGEFIRNYHKQFMVGQNLDIDGLKNDILLGMAQGNVYSLSERSISIKTLEQEGKTVNKIVSEEVVLYSLDDNRHTSTYNWNEGGGHITTIVEITDEGFIVSSWGRKHLVKFDDLKLNDYGYNFEIEMLKINNMDNKVSELIALEEELEKTAELTEVVGQVQNITVGEQTNIESLINDSNISTLTQEQIDSIFSNEALLNRACSSLSGESIVEILKASTSETAFMNLLNAMSNIELDDNGESVQLTAISNALKSYFASPDAKVSEYIQQITFNSTVFSLLSGVINTKTLMSNVNASQVESIFECLNSLYAKKRDTIVISLLESQSDEVFRETLKHVGDPFVNETSLTNAYAMLSGETIVKIFASSTSDNAFMDLLTAMNNYEVNNDGDSVKTNEVKSHLKEYFSSLSEEQLVDYIQQITFSKDIFDSLTGVIDTRTLISNINVNQLESICTCFNELSNFEQDNILRALFKAKSDEVLYETLNNVGRLNIWPAAAMERVLERGVDANILFSNKIDIIQRMIAWHYGSDERAKALIDSITDQNAINNLINSNVEITLERTDGKSIDLKIKDTLNMGGKTIYAYYIGKDIIFSENNLIEMFLRGDTGIKDFIVNDILSEKNIALAKQNNGIIPTYDFNYENRTYSTRTNDTLSLISDVYTKLFEQYRYGDKYTQFGANQRIKQIDSYHDILKQTKSGRYVLNDVRYRKIYNNLVQFLSQKYGMSQDMINTVIMKTIDVNAGVCSYANLANTIFMKFANDAEGFKNAFGFDMFETINGKKVFNYRTMIADMFIQMNDESLALTDHPVFKWIDGKLCFNTVTDENGNTRPADSREQVFMSNAAEAELYLKLHGLSGIVNRNFDTFISNNSVDIDRLKNAILFGMAQGKVYSLIEYASTIEVEENGQKVKKVVSDELVLYSLDNDSQTSSYSWNEGGGHITTIVGVTDDGFIVASWGKKYFVKFSDLKVNEYGTNFGIEQLEIRNVANMLSDQTIIEKLTTTNAVKTNGIIPAVNEIISQIKYDFVNSIAAIQTKVDMLRKNLIRSFRNIPSDVKYQIKDSMTALKKYLDSVSDTIKTGIKSSYESVVKGIDSILDIFNKSDIEIVSEANSIDLKETIMSGIDSNWDGIAQARKAYIELSKAVNYDPKYSHALQTNNKEVKAEIYNQDISFRTLEGRDVICKGWSQLYRELLIEIGFNPDDIVIMGGNNIGSHKWVRLDLHNGYVLLADAADVINGTNDIANCKIGSSTNGFLIVPYEQANVRPKDIELTTLIENQLQIKGYDNSIGYTKNGMYFDQAYMTYQQKYSKKIFSDKVLRNSFFKMEFTKEMDGTDAFVFMRRMCKLINPTLDDSIIEPEPHICFRNTENGVEVVAYLAVDNGNGKTKYLLYSKSLGKIIVKEGTISDLTTAYGLYNSN